MAKSPQNENWHDNATLILCRSQLRQCMAQATKGLSCSSQTWRVLKRQNKSSWTLHTAKPFSRDTIPKNRPLKQLYLQKRSHVFFPNVLVPCPFFWNLCNFLIPWQNGCVKTPARQVFDLVGLWDWWMEGWSQRLINYNHQWSCSFNVTRTVLWWFFIKQKAMGGNKNPMIFLCKMWEKRKNM